MKPVHSTENWPRRSANPAILLLTALVGLTALAALGCQESRRRDVGRIVLSRPVVVVNAEEVSLREFQAAYEDFLSRWDRFVQSDTEKMRQVKELILERFIEDKLLDQEARRKGIELSPENLRARVQIAIAPYEELYLEQAMGGQERSAEWQRRFRRRVIHRELIDREVLGRIRIAEREISEYYETHRDEFRMPEQVRVRHLAVGNRRAYNHMRRLLRRDADFVELIREHSITPDRESDGDLGYVERGVLPPEFDEVIFEMTRVRRINDLNKPVQTEIGYHIFRLEGSREARRLTRLQAAPMIRERLLRQKQPTAYRLWLRQLRERATIIVDRELLHAELG